MKKKANFAKKNHKSLNKSPENCDFFRLIFIGTAEIYLKQTFFLQKECYSQALSDCLFIFLCDRAKRRGTKKNNLLHRLYVPL